MRIRFSVDLDEYFVEVLHRAQLEVTDEVVFTGDLEAGDALWGLLNQLLDQLQTSDLTSRTSHTEHRCSGSQFRQRSARHLHSES